MVQMRSAGMNDDGATAGVDESKTQSFVIDNLYRGNCFQVYTNVYTEIQMILHLSKPMVLK